MDSAEDRADERWFRGTDNDADDLWEYADAIDDEDQHRPEDVGIPGTDDVDFDFETLPEPEKKSDG